MADLVESNDNLKIENVNFTKEVFGSEGNNKLKADFL